MWNNLKNSFNFFIEHKKFEKEMVFKVFVRWQCKNIIRNIRLSEIIIF